MPCGFEGEEGSWLANFTNNNLEWFEQYGVRYAEGFQNYLTEVIKTFPGKIKEMETELSRLEKDYKEDEKLNKQLEKARDHLKDERENKEKRNREKLQKRSGK